MLEKEGKVVPQLVIAGNAAIDDPEGIPLYNNTLELLRSKKYKHLEEDVKVSRLPHIDQLLNALMRRSKIALQLSIKEGFEVKVTEALMKGVPIVAYRTGGIPLQIKEGVNGYLIEPGNTKEVARVLYELMTDEKKYSKMSAAAEKYANKDYLTVPNALCWLYMAVRLIKGEEIKGNFAWVKETAHKFYKK
jgi:alpha,alpha-trehalose phosphorylase (configuration-retaining)